MRRFATRDIKDEEPLKNNRWLGISHGFYSVERDGNSEGSVLAQREQVEGLELWLFGAFDQQIGGGITKYLQSHLFQKNLNEVYNLTHSKYSQVTIFVTTIQVVA